MCVREDAYVHKYVNAHKNKHIYTYTQKEHIVMKKAKMSKDERFSPIINIQTQNLI